MTMRVWLYARLSNDDDREMNSLLNQQEICRAFAEKNGWSIAGSSADDNISGMNFSRRGLDLLTAAAQAKQVDAVLVKDLSRLGRHRTQTALFIDFLRQQQVRVISVTEGVDTFCEEDDLMIGVRGLMIDYYATGVLVNHRREYLGGKARAISEADWLRHENFYPVIIEKTIWQQVQTRLKQQARPAANNRTKHRYAGLLSCQECGNVFSPMIRYWNGSRRVEYVCRGYHRNGKGYCTSHRIHEEVLDKSIWDYTEKLRAQYAAELKKVTQLQKQWALRKPVLDAHCLTLQKEILRLEQEIDGLVMEKLNCDRLSSVHEISAEI